MKGKLSILGLVLTLSTLVISGCETIPEVVVDIPDVEVDVDVPTPEIPKVIVDIPDVEVDVDVPTPEIPEVIVDIPDVEVDVDVPHPKIPEVIVNIPDIEIDVDVPHLKITVDTRDSIKGSGNVVTEDRPVSNFDRVSLTGFGEVFITQGEEESLTVETDDNLMQYVETKVRNGTLILGFTDEVKNVRPTELKFNLSMKDITGLDLPGAGDITAPSIETDRLDIVLNGAGEINVDSLTTEKLEVHINGAGDIELTGQVVEQGVFLNGVGNYYAAELESQTTTVEVNGAGIATVWATDILDVGIGGAGAVRYHGNPSITFDASGIGKLVKLNNL
jgi:hypothetical protein